MSNPRPNPKPEDDPKPVPAEDVPLDQPTEDLIAFLDGELSAEQSEAIEARMNHDPQLRANADQLKMTWDLLDLLPRPEPSASFREQTISRIEPISSLSASSSGVSVPVSQLTTGMISTSLVVSRRRVWFFWIGLSVVASGLGWYVQPLIQRKIYPQEDPNKQIDAQIVSDVRILENLKYYRYIDDLDFLKSLDKPENFGDEPFVP